MNKFYSIKNKLKNACGFQKDSSKGRGLSYLFSLLFPGVRNEVIVAELKQHLGPRDDVRMKASWLDWYSRKQEDPRFLMIKDHF